MNDKSFLDTNILVYAASYDPGQAAKREIAVGLLRDPDDLAVSTQVLQEYYVVVTRKIKPAMTEEQAAASVRSLTKLPVAGIDKGLVLAAIGTSREAKISLWDALIIEAARQAGCTRVLTEDLSHGQVIRGVRIENPFLADLPEGEPGR